MRYLTEADLQTKITNIDTMLKIDNSLTGVPVRNIDYFIHRWDKEDDTQYNISEFLNHQLIIEMITENYEERIFNDSRAYNGITGPMSDVLRACYFHLYSKLLNKGLKINLENDFNTFISLLFGIRYDDKQDKLLIPKSEFEAIQNIIIQLRSLKPDNKFNDAWWETLKNSIKNIYDVKLPTWSYWNENPDQRNSFTIWNNWLLNMEFEPGIWEKHPCYVIDYRNNLDLDKNKTLKMINYLHALFLDPYSKECIDITECEGGVLVGGVNNIKYFNKYNKYKQKYLKLKSKLNQ